jgi:hypothetical protein
MASSMMLKSQRRLGFMEKARPAIIVRASTAVTVLALRGRDKANKTNCPARFATKRNVMRSR